MVGTAVRSPQQKDADQADSPSVVTCRSLNKLDDSTLLKTKSKLRGKSAKGGKEWIGTGRRRLQWLPWTTMTARLARCYLTALHKDPRGQTWLTVAMLLFSSNIDEKRP